MHTTCFRNDQLSALEMVDLTQQLYHFEKFEHVLDACKEGFAKAKENMRKHL